ncbi:phage tail tube protein [uncultured Devosia sp.]|uniref:phage tail tube protein n=1 Tax=uncultured Devosia sp. TaxID=211434 RepID=UPI002632E318|nr:phage tail tube protein [uncultured Devosia sp.]
MAKQRAVGADVVNLIGFEATYGTPPDGSGGGVYYRVPMRQYGLSPEQPPEDDPTWNLGSPDAGDPVQGPVIVNDAMTVPMCARNLGVVLKTVFGAPDSAETGVDSGVFEHEFVSGQELLSFASQTGHPLLSTPKWNTVYGTKAGGLNFDLARTGRALAEVPLIGQGETSDVGGARDATPIQLAYLPFDNAKAAITVGGSAIGNVSAGRAQYTNSLESAENIRADGLIDGVDEGERMCTGTLDVRYSTSTALETLANAKTPAAVVITYGLASHPDFSLVITMPRVFFFKPKLPINGPGGISQSWQWRAARDPDLGYLMSVVLTNDVDSY